MDNKSEKYMELPASLREDLKAYVHPIIACMHEVHNELGCGLPEYIYQEALTISLKQKGFNVMKEYTHHMSFMGQQLKSFIKMDMVVVMPRGNVIIECKAISKLGDAEHYQTFGYLRGTKFPIAILVNFGTFGRAQIERFYFKDNVITAF